MRSIQTLPSSYIHASYLRRTYSQLLVRSIDADGLLHAANLRLEDINIPDALIDIQPCKKLVSEARRISNCPWLGLEFARDSTALIHGVVGLAATACPDIRSALQTVARYAHLRTNTCTFEYVEDVYGGKLIISNKFSFDEFNQFLFESLFASLVRFFQTSIASNLDRIVVDLPFVEEKWSTIYRDFSACQLRFGLPRLTFHLPPEMLNKACVTADPEVMQTNLYECERKRQRLQGRKASFASRVIEVLRRIDLMTEGLPVLSYVADQLCVSSRTLMRNLKYEGTSFQSLLDSSNKELATWYLKNTQDSIEIIALRLGYQDPRNFSRTFRRWYDATPSEYRRRQDELLEKAHCVMSGVSSSVLSC